MGIRTRGISHSLLYNCSTACGISPPALAFCTFLSFTFGLQVSRYRISTSGAILRGETDFFPGESERVDGGGKEADPLRKRLKGELDQITIAHYEESKLEDRSDSLYSLCLSLLRSDSHAVDSASEDV